MSLMQPLPRCSLKTLCKSPQHIEIDPTLQEGNSPVLPGHLFPLFSHLTVWKFFAAAHIPQAEGISSL